MTQTQLPTPVTEPAVATARPVPRWAIHRRLYDWTAGLANTRHATWILGLVSFCEAIFFPIPPLVMQVPMTLERRDRAWFYAFVETVTSVLGGIGGYLLGMLAGGWLKAEFPRLFSPEHMAEVQKWTDNLLLLTGGAIAIHPYKLYTIAVGILGGDFTHFLIASIIGRGLLFFGVAALLRWFGAPVKHFIDTYFNLITVAVGVLVIAAVVYAKMR